MTNEVQERLYDDAVLGKQVDEFMSSDVGRFLAARIQDEYDGGVADLIKVLPADAESVRAAQNRVHRAEALDLWLREVIAKGVQATQVLEQRQFEDDDPTGS